MEQVMRAVSALNEAGFTGNNLSDLFDTPRLCKVPEISRVQTSQCTKPY